MKRSKLLLLYTLTIAAFALLEILLSVLYRAFPPRTVLFGQIIYYFSRVLAAIPPFLMLGAAVSAIRNRSFSSSLIFFFIYAGIFLFTQVPLSLLAYAASPELLYGVTLFSYMISSAITSLLFFFILVLIHAVFLHGKHAVEKEGTKLLSLESREARALLLASLLLMVYNLARETTSVLAHLKSVMYILSGEDVLDILIAFFFILLLALLCFITGRVGERLFPSLSEKESSDTDFTE